MIIYSLCFEGTFQKSKALFIFIVRFFISYDFSNFFIISLIPNLINIKTVKIDERMLAEIVDAAFSKLAWSDVLKLKKLKIGVMNVAAASKMHNADMAIICAFSMFLAHDPCKLCLANVS